MNLLIEGEGSEAVQETADLLDWLHEARLRDVQEIVQDKLPPRPGEQGPEMLQALQIVLAAPAVIALVGCVKAYIAAKKPTMRMTFKTKDGSLVLDAQNPPPIAELERMAKTLLPG